MFKKTLTTLFVVVTAIAGLARLAEAQTAKVEAVKKLIDLTLPAYPAFGLDEQLVLQASDKEEKEVQKTQKQNQLTAFDDALVGNNELTPNQKSFVKANYDKLG